VTIGEVAQASGVVQRMIRHYETIGLFPNPYSRDSGYRTYG
jgi:MerR family copper efflux transcriptional regulator